MEFVGIMILLPMIKSEHICFFPRIMIRYTGQYLFKANYETNILYLTHDAFLHHDHSITLFLYNLLPRHLSYRSS